MLNAQRSMLNAQRSMLMRYFCFTAALFFYVSHAALAQEDSLKLACLLNEKLEAPAEKKATTSIGADDLKATWISRSDTIVKACTSGMVTVILHDADGKWELMFTHNFYTFWYSGISRLAVDKGQRIRENDPVGYTKKGEKIILQMMDAESSVDPKEFLDCR